MTEGSHEPGRIGNKYLADTEPWKLAKSDMPRVATILHLALQISANLAIAFEPFLPFSAAKLRTMLGLATIDWDMLGRTDILAAGTQLAQPNCFSRKSTTALSRPKSRNCTTRRLPTKRPTM